MATSWSCRGLFFVLLSQLCAELCMRKFYRITIIKMHCNDVESYIGSVAVGFVTDLQFVAESTAALPLCKST